MAAKYIAGLIACGHGSIRAIAVTFPEHIEHRVMARNVFGNFDYVVGAGMFHVNVDEHGDVYVHAHGESAGLNLRCRGEDDEFLIAESMGLKYRDRGHSVPRGATPGGIMDALRLKNGENFEFENPHALR